MTCMNYVQFAFNTSERRSECDILHRSASADDICQCNTHMVLDLVARFPLRECCEPEFCLYFFI